MSIKTKWLDARQIKELRRSTAFVGSNELTEQLDEFLNNNTNNDGAYLVNILSNDCIRELQKLGREFFIAPLFTVDMRENLSDEELKETLDEIYG